MNETHDVQTTITKKKEFDNTKYVNMVNECRDAVNVVEANYAFMTV